MYPSFETFDINTNAPVTIHGVRGGTGPPMLLLHGFPQTHWIWHKIADRLAQHFTLVIPDLRGYGASSKPANKENPHDHSLYAKSTMAIDLHDIMTELGFSEYYVVGHDRGGRVAHKLCVDFPQDVKKCLLLDICPTLAMFEAMNLTRATAYWHWLFLIQPTPFPEEMILAKPAAFAKKLLQGLPKGGKSGGDVQVFSDEAYAEYERLLGDPATVHTMCEDYRASATQDMEESRADIKAGRKIKCPLRVIWGKHGLIEKEFNAIEEWQKVTEDGLVDKKSGAVDCGHFIPEEAPEDTLEHILDFFRE